MKMKFIRRLLDKTEEKLFAPGKPFSIFYPFFEAANTFFFTPDLKTTGKCHVRDCNDFKRMMIAVCYALIPCVIMGMYNVGYQTNVLLEQNGLTASTGWHGWILNGLNQLFAMCNTWLPSFLQINVYDPSRLNILGNLIHGAVYFIPLYAVTMIVGLGWEILFAMVNKHDVNEGFFVTGLIFPLTLPPAVPLWQVAVAITFGVIFGKEIFGGTGRNFLNPALVARAFLFFAYAGQISGDRVWTTAGVDGIAKATPLSYATSSDMVTGGVHGLHSAGYNIMDSFIGLVPGSFGETSTVACLIGMVFLLFVGVASWRIVASMAVGGMGLATLFWYFGGQSNAAMGIGPVWHFVLGGFAFGMVFMATDPVTAAMTRTGQYLYGLLVGALVIVIRVLNPAYPEGTMLVILFGNCCAPLIDYMVVQSNIERRQNRIAGRP
ncbi:MAG: NADH:ubiquinone reductase (Na(+)-transporting) subunit B [Planctomycetia bacterium]|nr:NADH:ubiquinone reductase (Na(+)-transporting) subunit B [Planctomycetia bacterium]